MDDTLARRLAEIESAFEETEAALSDPETLSNPAMLAELGKRHADLRDVVSDIRRLRELGADLEDARAMADDPDMADMARDLADEIGDIEDRVEARPDPDRSGRRQGRDPRDPICGRRRRGSHLGRETCFGCTSDMPTASGWRSSRWTAHRPKPAATTR